MRQYKYKAQSRSGVEVTGVVDAMDEFAAIEQIKATCPVVYEISEVQADIGKVFAKKKISLKKLALMCNQFSIILSSGLPLVQSTNLIAEQVEDKTLKTILENVSIDVSGGMSLSDSFEKNGPGLPTAFIESVRAGEQTGNLDKTFAQLSKYFEKQVKTKSKLTSALIYPTIVLSVAVIVIFIIMVYAVPVFTKTLTDLGTELPFITKMLIAVSNFFTNNILIIILSIALLILAVNIFKKTEPGKKFFASLQLRLPLIGKVVQMSNAASFAGTMSTMSTAGLTLVKSVVITGKTMTNYVMGLDIQEAASGLETGRKLAECLRKSEYLPKMLVEMVSVGEETGALESTMDVISTYYENETDTATQRVLSMIEPAMIIFLAVIVGGILLAVYLPMFSMYGSIS